MSKKHCGKCALCGRDSDLSFEHIPPREAFNWTPAKPVSGDQLLVNVERMPWDITGLPYKNQQRGMGLYSLCSACNNNTGSWYGEDYIGVVHAIHRVISKPLSQEVTGIKITNIHPLRFIKQVLSMFCSINEFVNDETMSPLREFVLNRSLTQLDYTKYKLCMYISKSNLIKYAPFSVVCRGVGSGQIEIISLSEIVAYPVGFILYFDPVNGSHFDGFDITNFATFNYDTVADIMFPLDIKEINNIFPLDYRSKEEILQCIEENKKWCEENGNSPKKME